MATTTRRTSPASPEWEVAVPIGLVSVLTMPLTAIWFAFIGSATLVAAAIAAAAADTCPVASSRLRTGGSIAIGMLAGPSIYLVLAVLSS